MLIFGLHFSGDIREQLSEYHFLKLGIKLHGKAALTSGEQPPLPKDLEGGGGGIPSSSGHNRQEILGLQGIKFRISTY